MPALTSDRNTHAAQGDARQGAVAAGERIFAGALIMRNATGYLVKGATALNLVGVGRAEEASDNTGGADGDISVPYRPGVFLYRNDLSDPVTLADCGSVCFAVDDQTVAATDGTGTRSKAGIVDMIDPNGVRVRLDEALTKIAN
ncbi:hypothetical protein [Ruegeria sp. PrR005]|uniref:Uncharacterized protein n=1 Tax=Ruegeria sp. PrR005 TaxID=2706882 RepID=A0A6B2NRA8_9RHOB|nr:hypothetical protein [Ruegeria sp. PrR005]NDW44395.1 hypothetical protein [Ruegeria sp. PrR005]